MSVMSKYMIQMIVVWLQFFHERYFVDQGPSVKFSRKSKYKSQQVENGGESTFPRLYKLLQKPITTVRIACSLGRMC